MSTGTILSLAGSLLVLGLVLLGVAGMIGAGSLERNGTVGIRTRATVASERAWVAGHRAASRALRGSGGLCLAAGLVAAVLALLVPAPFGSPIGLGAVCLGYVALAVGLVLAVRRADRACRDC